MRQILLRVAGFLISGSLAFGQAVSFLAPVNTNVGSGSRPAPAQMAVADFNGDGKPDLAYEVPDGQLAVATVVLFGNGDGTFRNGPTLPAGAPFTADFNGEGKPDILIGPPGQTAILLGNGDGTFQAPVAVPACAGFQILGDFNNDRKADLVCGNSVLLGHGDGTFAAAIPLPVDARDSVVLAADFNRDGNLDLLLRQAGGGLSVVLGQGDGTFGAEAGVVAASPQFRNLVVGDFNGDGVPDLAGACGSGGPVCVAPGNGDGTFGAILVNQGLLGSPAAAADFNGDGKLDLVGNDGAVLAGNGDGTFRAPVFIQAGSIAIADFNGDGKPDIANGVAHGNSGVIAVLLNDGPGDGFYTAGVSSASWVWPVDQGTITSAFGVNLAPKTETASVTNDSFPTTLGGIRLHVRDSTGDSLAPLLYVSPTQINYIMTSTEGFAWIGIERVGSPYVPKGIGLQLGVLRVGFFAASGGVAVATAVRVAPDGTQTPVPAISCSGAACNALPIDVSGDPVYLSLYGTGFDSVPVKMGCNAGPVSLPVTYAGPQRQMPGLDQVNLQLPAELAGAGTVSIVCNNYQEQSGFNVGPSLLPGPPSNAVHIAIQ